MAAETGEDRCERLIRQAHDGLPAPDPRRLAAIEASLAERQTSRRTNRRWWFAAALVAAAGSAAALWWTLDYPSRQEANAVAPAVLPPVGAEQSGPTPAGGSPANGGVPPDADRTQTESRGRIIYRQHR